MVIDKLTKIANETAFMQDAKRFMALAERNFAETAFIKIDIDHFEALNDEHGCDFGNLVLIAFAERLRKILRIEDSFARLKGDSFIIMLPFTSTLSSFVVAEKVHYAVMSEPFAINDEMISLTISLGISIGSFEENLELLIEQAGIALQKAKDSGRNVFVLYEEDLSEDKLMDDPKHQIK